LFVLLKIVILNQDCHPEPVEGKLEECLAGSSTGSD